MPAKSKPTVLKWITSFVDLKKKALPWLGANDVRTVRASVLGPFAVYATQDRRMPLTPNVRKFTLSHVPSGCLAVCYSNSEKDLQRIALYLAQRCGVAFSLETGDKIKASLPAEVREWIDACYNEGGWVEPPGTDKALRGY